MLGYMIQRVKEGYYGMMNSYNPVMEDMGARDTREALKSRLEELTDISYGFKEPINGKRYTAQAFRPKQRSSI